MSTLNKQKTEYVIRKIIQMLIVLVVLSIVIFVIARLCPGDPLRAYYGDGLDRMSESQKALARSNLGLDQPMITQYFHWISDLFSGNLGISYKYKQPVTAVISSMWLNTLLLGLVSYILTFWFAVGLGRFLALRENSRIDYVIGKLGVVSGVIPSFFLALILILVFAVNLHILPTGGAYSYGQSANVLDRAYHLILPVTVMVLGHLWYYAYMVRNMLLEEARKDYVLLCKAEGIPRNVIMKRYCMKNILPQLFVIMALAVPHILGGTYVVEMVFGYPGLGTLSFESALYQDYNMLMALSMLTGLVVLICNLAAQLAGEFMDPRMKHGEPAGGSKTGGSLREEVAE